MGPSGAGEPLSNRAGKLTALGQIGEMADEDGSVAAESARNIERWLAGFAIMAVLSTDHGLAVFRIGVKPHHGEVGALVRCGVTAAVDATLLGRFFERFGDHTAVVGRRVIFLVTGEQLPH